ncbi:hypothetical protein C8J56DRAFT_1063367 [Mycena floridula]|nr:hypothetical protein C8J56DRAFT_1063367 [Mycena floridula]
MPLADVENLFEDDLRSFKAWALYRDHYVTELTQYITLLLKLQPSSHATCQDVGRKMLSECLQPSNQAVWNEGLPKYACESCRVAMCGTEVNNQLLDILKKPAEPFPTFFRY